MAAPSFVALEQTSLQEIGFSQIASFVPGQVTTFFTSVSLLWMLGIMACVGAGVFVFIRSGVFRMQASEASIRKSNEEFKRGSLGLLGVLILFLMIDTVNKDLLIGNIDLGSLRVSGGVQSQPNNSSQATPNTNNAVLPGDGQSKLAALNANNVFINHGNVPCTTSQMSQQAPACTSLEGLPNESINVIIALSKACTTCSKITVVGGTEPGHDPDGKHGIGRPAFDLEYSGSLYDFLKKNGTPLGGDKYGWGGYVFWNEQAGATKNTTGHHFHVYK